MSKIVLDEILVEWKAEMENFIEIRRKLTILIFQGFESFESSWISPKHNWRSDYWWQLQVGNWPSFTIH